MIKKILHSVIDTFRNTGSVVVSGFRVLKDHPQILIYPYLGALFILLTFPIVNGLVFRIWNDVAHNSIFTVGYEAPRNLRILLGLVAFSVFYTIFVTAYFTTAMAATALAKLDGRSVPPLYGLLVVLRNFTRVTKFAILAIFFFPISIIAQRHKLPKGLPGMIGSSFSLSMAQLAPAILSENKGVMATIRQSVDTLGAAWRENVLIKIAMWLVIVLLLSIGFLPQLLQEHWVDADTAWLIGALSTILLSFTGYVVTKVIGSVFIAALYHRAAHKKARK